MESISDHPQTVEGLKTFISEEHIWNTEQLHEIEQFFEQASGSIESPPLGELTGEDEEKLRQKRDKDEKKNLMMEQLKNAE